MLMELRNISKSFDLGGGGFMAAGRRLSVLEDVSLGIERGEILGLVGESGSGKSTLSSIAIRLTAPDSGQVIYSGEDITKAEGKGLRAFRARAQMVFQDSTSSLNPRKKIGRTLKEALAMRGHSKAEHIERATSLLELVGLGKHMLQRHPHELSGGQRQRVSIARALAMDPEFLIADEPVASLDVSLQAQIVNLLLDLRERLKLTLLFISHDLALVGQISDRIAIIERGRLVDLGKPEEVFRNKPHPYTAQLLASIPRPRFAADRSPDAISGRGPG
jgi:peptide/nickel transport system ATP-binding protein